MNELIKSIVLGFSHYFYGLDKYDIKLERFKNYFDNYINNMNFETRNHRFVERNNIDYSIRKYSKVELKLDQGELQILIPSQWIMPSYYSQGKPVIVSLFSNGKYLFGYRLNLLINNYSYRTEEFEIHLNRFYPNLSYEIKYNNICLDSKILIEKEYLFFDLNGKQINSNNLNYGQIRVITKKDVEVDLFDTISDVNLISNYKITSFLLKESTFFSINNFVFRIMEEKFTNKIFLKDYNKARIVDENNISYVLCNEVPKIGFIIEHNNDINDYVIERANGLISFIDNSTIVKKYLISDGSNNEYLIFKLDETIFEKNSFNRIIIRKRGSNNVILESNYIVVDKFKLNLDKAYYSREKEGYLKGIESELNLFKSIDYPIKFIIDKESNIDIPLNNKIKLQIGLPFISWSIGSFNSNGSKVIPYEDIRNARFNLYYPIENYKIRIERNDNGYIILENNLISDILKSYCDETDLIFVNLILIYGNTRFQLCKIFFKPFIDNFNILENEEVIKFSWDYVGSKNLQCSIYNLNNNKKSKNKFDRNKNEIILNKKDYVFSKYEVKLYYEDIFGNENILKKESLCFGNFDLVVGHNIYFQVINFTQNGYPTRVKNLFLTYVKKIENNVYEAKCFHKEGDDEIPLRNLNPVRLELINSQYAEFAIVDRYNQPIFLDRTTRLVSNFPDQRNNNKYIISNNIHIRICI